VTGMIVRRDRRREGVGRALLQHLEQRAVDHGIAEAGWEQIKLQVSAGDVAGCTKRPSRGVRGRRRRSCTKCCASRMVSSNPLLTVTSCVRTSASSRSEVRRQLGSPGGLGVAAPLPPGPCQCSARVQAPSRLRYLVVTIE
jgi:hypothetical protein